MTHSSELYHGSRSQEQREGEGKTQVKRQLKPCRVASAINEEDAVWGNQGKMEDTRVWKGI